MHTTEDKIYLNAEELSGKISGEILKIHPDYVSGRELAAKSGRDYDWDLCLHGVITENDLIAVYSRASGVPVIDDEHLGALEKIEGFSQEFLVSKCILPLKRTGEAIELAVCEPYTLSKTEYLLDKLYNLKTVFHLCRRSNLERIISSIYESSAAQAEEDTDFSAAGSSEEALRNLASEAKVVRLVNEIFSRAVEGEASDIHIEPEEEKLVVRFRIDGLLHEHLSLPLNQYPAIASRIKLIGGMNIAESRLPQDGRTNIQIGKNEFDMRISTIPTMNGESIVLRILRKDNMDFNLKNVGMNETMCVDFEKLINLPHGMLLVVGPTGSGKTTTLYSIMSSINKPDIKIITIEDPVEYRISRLSQMQVNPKIGLDFANGLRHIVRQDPDVILVGEIRDKETADIAIHAALTGHLVFSTLHTNDAAGAVSRLLDMGIEGFLISSALCGVLSQRLVRKNCKACSGTGKDTARLDGKCRICSGTGFKGRTGIFELMVVNDDVRNAIARSSDSATIAAIAKENGMIPLLEDGKNKVLQRITTEAELARAVSDTL